MQTILIIIEKLDGSYYAYSPNLPGCAAKGQTREEVERKMIATIERRLELLRAQAQKGLEQNLLMQGSLEESIQCMGKMLSGEQCRLKAKKDGLCTRHWRVLYSHKMNADSAASKRFCLICGYKEGRNEMVGSLDSCPGRSHTMSAVKI